MIELIDFMMQHFLRGVTLNMLFGHIQTLKLIILSILSKFNLSTRRLNFINLPSIFKDKFVISSITNNFENMESPIICNKYNKNIRSTVFNYNKLVTELNIYRKFYS